MLQKSVINKTSQSWKLYVSILLMVFGSVAPAFDQTGLSWTMGTVIAVAGYVFGLAFISCPACGQRWFVKALWYAELYGPLFRKSDCPTCQKNFE